MSASRAKGTRFESEVVAYLQANGFPYAERRALGGSRDRGDVAGIPGVVLECKNEKAISLATYVKEAATAAGHAKAPTYAAVVKRRGKGPADAYVVMPLSILAALLRDDLGGGTHA
jgi:hypothetical protein